MPWATAAFLGVAWAFCGIATPLAVTQLKPGGVWVQSASPFPSETTMLHLAAPLFEQNLGYARRLVADLTDEQMTAQPVGGRVMNHAAFVVGHLAWVCDVGVTLLGEPPAIDPSWRDVFSMTATPAADRGVYPEKAVLVRALEDAHARLVKVALAATPETLQQSPPERFQSRFPTVAHVVLHMLTNHAAVHLGQFSAWRRASGLPAVSRWIRPTAPAPTLVNSPPA
jgi:hypothetical protein